MAQFDVYRNTNPETNQTAPYLLDIQADLLNALSTRVVVPLIISSKMGKITHLNPQFTISNTPVLMSTAELAGISFRLLGEKMCSLKSHRTEIIAALDFLLLRKTASARPTGRLAGGLKPPAFSRILFQLAVQSASFLCHQLSAGSCSLTGF